MPELDLVGPKEVAEMAGVNGRSGGTVYVWINRGILPEPERFVSGTRIWRRSVIEQWLRDTGRLPEQKLARLKREAATVSANIETVAESAPTPGAEVIADEDVLSLASDAETLRAGQPAAPAQADQDWNIHKIPKGIKLVRDDVTRAGTLVLFKGKPVGRVSHDKPSGLWTASKPTGAQATFPTRILCTNFLAPASNLSNFETHLSATRAARRPRSQSGQEAQCTRAAQQKPWCNAALGLPRWP